MRWLAGQFAPEGSPSAAPAFQQFLDFQRYLPVYRVNLHGRDEHPKQQEAERALARAEAAELRLKIEREAPKNASPAAVLPRLDDRAVLCVGGRQASVPVYRRLIEGIGARFLHHDGGEQDNVGQLDSTLESADLVICQTGCISHDAYWRVKDHCKRTGKRCVFVESPSRACLQRALNALSSADKHGPVLIPIAAATSAE